MIQCQECQSETTVKNGIVPEKQRYQCQSCGCNFMIGDSGLNPVTERKANFRFLAKLFDVSPATTYQSLRQSAETVGETVVSAEVKEIEIDQMWHCLQSKKPKMDHPSSGS